MFDNILNFNKKSKHQENSKFEKVKTEQFRRLKSPKKAK